MSRPNKELDNFQFCARSYYLRVSFFCLGMVARHEAVIFSSDLASYSLYVSIMLLACAVFKFYVVMFQSYNNF